MGNYLRLLSLATLLCTQSSLAAELSLSIQHPERLGSRLSTVQRLVQTALERMPPSLKAGIRKPVHLEFKKLEGTSPEGEITCDGRLQLGKTTHLRDRIQIVMNASLLRGIEKGPGGEPTRGCRHADVHRLALATLLHELSHAYDLQSVNPGAAIEDPLQPKPTIVGLVSSRQGFLNLAGWKASGVSPKEKNQLRARSADPYEFESPQEAFAVAMEYFLVDPQFACRRPALADYLASTFNDRPFPAGSCVQNWRAFLSGSGAPIDLDPKRVYQIHYLLASKGDSMMSRWGHSMIRIVTCAPQRQNVGPECLADEAYHVVISYRANISDLILSQWAGLTGDYPSQLFMFHLSEVVEEYTRTELRDLISAPLLLTDSEKETLLKNAVERFWSYSGKYYFLTNNCASESRDLIQSALDESHPFQRENPDTPNGLLSRLIRAGLVDRRTLEQTPTSGRTLFPSNRLALEQAYARTTEAFPGLLQEYPEGMKSFLQKSTAAERRKLSEQALSLPSDRKRKLLGALLQLEEQARRLVDAALTEAVGTLIQDEHPALALSAPLDALKSAMKDLLPWMTTPQGGYGIPQGIESPTPAFLAERQLRRSMATFTLQKELEKALDMRMVSERRAIRANLAQLSRQAIEELSKSNNR